MRSSLLVRIRILCAFFIVLSLLIAVRLYFVQVVNGSGYRKQAMGQYVEASPDTEMRGNIYFTTKDGALVAAAVMQSGWRIAITPKDLEGAASAYKALSALTNIDKEKFMASAAKTDDPYEEVAFRVDDVAARKIRALKLKGVLLVQDQWRAYPGGELAAGTVGFVGYKGNTKVGVYGIEKAWNTTLTETSSGLYVNPFAEIFTNVTALVSSDPSTQQGDVITTVEPAVQAQLEKTLDAVMSTYTSALAGGIIMDPHTGAIYAMASRPTFDPNTYNTVSDHAVFGNPLVEGRFELGSIMKPLTMAIGMDSGAVTTSTTYNDTGCFEVSTYKICNFDLKARNTIPVQEILNQSLNVGASFVATRTTYPVFTTYMRSLFSGKTGIDLPNEVTDDLTPLGTGHGPAVNYDTASFGQGIAVSPIEMIRALSALANGGVLPAPHVVSAIRYQSGIARAIAATSGPQVFKATSAQTVTNMLTTVYDTALLKGALKMDHYSIAAKTGTAQMPKPGGGYYPPGTYLHSFFGYFPAHDPKFIVFLFTIRPHGQEYASATLARPFSDIAKFLINYYNISPDR